MSQNLELQVDILQTLWAYAQGGTPAVTEDAIFQAEYKIVNNRIGPVTRSRVNYAIRCLTGHKYLECITQSDNSIKYKVSDKGMEWIDCWYTVVYRQTGYAFYRKYNDSLIVGSTRAEWEQSQQNKRVKERSHRADHGAYYWTKLGVFVSIIAIGVTVLIAWID